MISALSVWSAYHFIGFIGGLVSKSDTRGLSIAFAIISWMSGSIALYADFTTLFLLANFSLISMMFLIAVLVFAISPPGPEKVKSVNSILLESVIRLTVTFACWMLS